METETALAILKEEENTHPNLSGSKRRELRSCYREIERCINEGKDDIADATSKKFMAIMNEVENIHQHVSKPREQVADAEAFLGLTSILVDSVRSHSKAGVTPVEFVSCLIREFGQVKRQKENSYNVSWQDIGYCVSPIFKSGSGCRTMIGPMKNELKPRKRVVRAKRARPMKKTIPEELETTVDLVSNTDRNIHVMFEVLKRKKKAEVECLVLNRYSFAQTVENLFALSFLVKDGRVHMYVDETGARLVVPRNGPSAEEIKSGVAKNDHFVFRLDFNDWEVMKRYVPDGEEVMPQRYTFDVKPCSAKSNDEESVIPEAIPIDSRFVCTVAKHARNYVAIPCMITT
ncbi:non-structural maintenance of chromosomes element 4 homolog A-like [Salvia miltiorrhiza]|uniref:non-structural maintenance of chromosomes element 4 homolog A-like n=1 Tax=Salvia miltiorrhiza TaxID=226208 RepID=UPI0025ABDBCD|nr:non-structural maintenance of chromosomes element 4 homolog A-like [Salvia miltiorrhiza]